MLALIWMSTSMASPYKALINLGKTFLRISRIRIILLTQILARVFVYLPPLISQILDFICRMVFIFILIYFEWRDTENLQYICVRCKNMLRTITIPGSNSGSQRKKNPGLNRINRERLFFFSIFKRYIMNWDRAEWSRCQVYSHLFSKYSYSAILYWAN